jgi:hypothetical protein
MIEMINEIYIASPLPSLLWREKVIRRKLPLPLRSESTRTEERVGVRGKLAMMN